MKRGVVCDPDCRTDIVRASGDVECEQCANPYRDHSYCAGSELRDTGFYPQYFLHVLCDGTHVKL